jgi:thioredoxin 1
MALYACDIEKNTKKSNSIKRNGSERRLGVSSLSKVIELQAEAWDKEVKRVEGPVVVDFWHNMCGWCLKLNPIFEQLPEQLQDAKYAKMNILDSTENRNLAMEHGVMGTPTIKVFCEGRDIGEIVGFRTLDKLVNELKAIFASREDCIAQSTPLE